MEECDLVSVEGPTGPSYETTSGLDVATRHLPLAEHTSILEGEARREDISKLAEPLLQSLGVIRPTLDDAQQALTALLQLHSIGTHPDFGGTRTSGNFRVEMKQRFAMAWRELLWTLTTTAGAHRVYTPVLETMRELTQEANGGPKAVATPAPFVVRQQPNTSVGNQRQATQEATSALRGSLFEQHWDG